MVMDPTSDGTPSSSRRGVAPLTACSQMANRALSDGARYATRFPSGNHCGEVASAPVVRRERIDVPLSKIQTSLRLLSSVTATAIWDSSGDNVGAEKRRGCGDTARI